MKVIVIHSANQQKKYVFKTKKNIQEKQKQIKVCDK